MHMVDLDRGYAVGDWPMELVQEWLPSALAQLPDRAEPRDPPFLPGSSEEAILQLSNRTDAAALRSADCAEGIDHIRWDYAVLGLGRGAAADSRRLSRFCVSKCVA